MPAKTSPVKVGNGSRKGRRSPSPVWVSSEPDDVPDNESDTLSTSVPVPHSTSGVRESPDVDIDQLIKITRLVGKKRGAPKTESDIEIGRRTNGKKPKTDSAVDQSSSSVLAALDDHVKIEKRVRRPTEKAKAVQLSDDSSSKKKLTVVPVENSTFQYDGDSSIVEPTSIQPVNTESERAISESAEEVLEEEPERGELSKCVLVPFSSNAKASEDETMMDLETFFHTLLTKTHVRVVKSALTFTSYAPFINPSMASPELVLVEKDHLVWADSRLNAVFFTTGCVSACNLITPAPGINNSAAAKKLLLFPIEGIFQDALDFFGNKFNISHAAGQLSNGVITYSTKKEDAMGSPKKRGLFKKPSSKTAASSGSSFPVALSFGDDVPIYDATGTPFEFTGSKLAKLRALPLFRKGAHDLPPYAVVTVGYTVTSFATSNSASANTAFLFNILFAVLLAEKIKEDEDE